MIMIMLATTVASAKSTTWNLTGGGAWTTSGNWSNGTPVGGDDVIINGTSAAITSMPTITLNSLTVNGSSILNASSSGNTLTISSTFFVAAVTFTLGNASNSRINLVLNGTSTINGTLTMNPGASSAEGVTVNGTLTMAPAAIINDGSNNAPFTLSSGATFQIGSTAGITSGTTASGHIQVTGTRTYSTGANYTYNGTGNQNMGNGFPTNLTGDLTINNQGNVVTLDNARTIANTGVVNLTAGTFAAGTNLTMASTSTINRSEGSMTGNVQGTGVYNVNYTGNSKTAGTELSGSGLYNVTLNLTAGQVLTSSATVITVDNDLTVSQGEFVLSANDGNYNFKNVIVETNGKLTHSIAWDVVPNRLVSISGNLNVTGIFNPTVRSHVNMNTAGSKTIQTGDNPSSTLSILTFSDGTFSASGTLKTNQEVWAMFGTSGSFSTNGNNVTFSSLNNNNGTVNVNGGSLTISGNCEAGWGGSAGVMNVSSGTFSVLGSLIISTAGSLTCSNSPSVNIGGNFTNNNSFTPATSTVTLNGGGSQSLSGAMAFYNLALAGSGAKSFGAGRTISNYLSIASGATADLGTFTSSANTLSLNGSGAPGGSWGSSSSPATHKNDLYFAATTGILNVSAGTCPTVTATINGQSNPLCNGNEDGTITIQAGGAISPYFFSVNNGGSWISSGNNPYTYSGLSADTAYRIKVKDSLGCESK